MTTLTAPPTRSPRARTGVPLDAPLRALRTEVARWALATGRPLNVDAVGVVIAARHAEAVTEGGAFNRWTTNSVLTFLFGTADEWCARQGIAVPLHLGESLLTYIEFLADQRVLAPGSSTLRQLRTTIIDLTGLTPDGLRRVPRTGPGAVRPSAPIPLAARRA